MTAPLCGSSQAHLATQRPSGGVHHQSSTNVTIKPVSWTGTLVGLSPIKRTFDFKREGSKELISGKFSHQVSQDHLERNEGDVGITLGERFIAWIEIGTITKPDGSISVSYTVIDLELARTANL